MGGGGGRDRGGGTGAAVRGHGAGTAAANVREASGGPARGSEAVTVADEESVTRLVEMGFDRGQVSWKDGYVCE